jgi:hypothetical protein
VKTYAETKLQEIKDDSVLKALVNLGRNADTVEKLSATLQKETTHFGDSKWKTMFEKDVENIARGSGSVATKT